MTREEVILSMGLDHASLKTGLSGADFLVQNSVRSMMNSLKSLVKINLITIGNDLLGLWDRYTKSLFSMMDDAAASAPALDATRRYWREQRKNEAEAAAAEEKRQTRIEKLREELSEIGEQLDIESKAGSDAVKRLRLEIELTEKKLDTLNTTRRVQAMVNADLEQQLITQKAIEATELKRQTTMRALAEILRETAGNIPRTISTGMMSPDFMQGQPLPEFVPFGGMQNYPSKFVPKDYVTPVSAPQAMQKVADNTTLLIEFLAKRGIKVLVED